MARIFKLTTEREEGLAVALKALQQGELVAVPTETVYGLAADATQADAVARIYKAKGRPSFNPLIVHVDGLEMAQATAVFDPISLKLANHFWPGSLTLVLPLRNNSIANAVTAGLDTIALRHPKGVMADLAGDLGNPIAAPSANSSGRISPTIAAHVEADIGKKVDIILNDGPCTVGIESTIVKVVEGKVHVLRVGGISNEEIAAIVGEIHLLTPPESEAKIEAPGMLLAHYAPRTKVRLDAQTPKPNEALLAFGETKEFAGVPSCNLSLTKNLDEAAHNLFAMLKILDDTNSSCIAVQPIPHHGLGAAINDRLKRAAQGANQA